MDFFNKIFKSSNKNRPGSSDQDPKMPENLLDFDTPRPDEGDVKCVTVLIVGAGSRGMCYTYYAVNFPKRMKFTQKATNQYCGRGYVELSFQRTGRSAAERDLFTKTEASSPMILEVIKTRIKRDFLRISEEEMLMLI
ncbi:unnamed protein product [Ranitomeya imitator]|uniref:Uncharacterized protein n=1 Tax=Ranitomeya imitator TaxID=111125 RepID=A0ABN9KPN5_9NEOB|nr:unnamed protein product [Ranitomeya imitator]